MSRKRGREPNRRQQPDRGGADLDRHRVAEANTVVEPCRRERGSEIARDRGQSHAMTQACEQPRKLVDPATAHAAPRQRGEAGKGPRHQHGGERRKQRRPSHVTTADTRRITSQPQ